MQYNNYTCQINRNYSVIFSSFLRECDGPSHPTLVEDSLHTQLGVAQGTEFTQQTHREKEGRQPSHSKPVDQGWNIIPLPVIEVHYTVKPLGLVITYIIYYLLQESYMWLFVLA